MKPVAMVERLSVRPSFAIKADFLVMASHVLGIPDHFFSSHGGKVATRAAISLFVAR